MKEEQEYDGAIILCANCNDESTFTEVTGDDGYFVCSRCDACRHEFTKDSFEKTYKRCVYKETCECGKEMMLLTQPDRHPEYNTEVGAQCSNCPRIVWFSLPVN